MPSVFVIDKRVAEMGTAPRMPTMLWDGQGDAGVLMSYGTSFAATYACVPIFVDRILKGAKPGDTAFEIVSQRKFVINLKTARELGLSVPPALLKRADHIVE